MRVTAGQSRDFAISQTLALNHQNSRRQRAPSVSLRVFQRKTNCINIFGKMLTADIVPSTPLTPLFSEMKNLSAVRSFQRKYSVAYFQCVFFLGVNHRVMRFEHIAGDGVPPSVLVRGSR